MLCFGLQGLFATKILRKLKVKDIGVIFGSLLIILSPIHIYRLYMHTALTAHWLVLAAIYLYLKHDEDYLKYKKVAIEWFTLGILVAGIHLYFLPMLFFILVGYVCLSIYKDRKEMNLKKVILHILPIATYVIAVLLMTWILGGFSSSADSGASGLGACNLNLNAFFNPRGYSVFFDNLNDMEGQHEGFAYLGFGLIILIGISVIYSFINKRWIRIFKAENIILASICLVSIIFSIANVYMWGDKVLFTISLPEKIEEIWSVFRATGRYVWITWYVVAFGSIKVVSDMKLVKLRKNSIGSIVLIMCVILQLTDMSKVLYGKHQTYTNDVVYEYAEEEFWESIMEYRDFKHICISYWIHEIPDYMEWGAIASKYDLSITQFYFARNIDGMLDGLDELSRGEAQPDTIYVFLPEQENVLEENQHKVKYYNVDKYIIGISWLDEAGNVNDF